jgi:hypothetical protein
VQGSKFPITKDQLLTFPKLILTYVLNVDAIEHVSTKQHLQVLNVQALIDDTNNCASKGFHVSNTNVDFVNVRKWMSNPMRQQVPLVTHFATIANT